MQSESHGFNLFPAKPLPLQLTASVRMRLEGLTEFGTWGLENVKLMKKYRKRAMVLAALGFTPPSGRLLFDDSGELTTKLQNKKTLVHEYEKSKKILKSILVSSGAKWITLDFLNRDGRARKSMKFGSAHHVGSCRMADTSKRGVVNPAGEVYGYPDMYVTDGAVIPSSLSVNTSLTILANAERISEGLLGKYRL